MIKSVINDVVKSSIENKDLIAVKAVYNPEAIFFYAINQSKDFFLGVEEFDFELDGYQIRKYEDISNVKIVRNFSSEINKKEGLIEKIIKYNINLESFETIFNDLKGMGGIIAIEREYDDEDNFFVIGIIEKVTETSVWFRDFTVDGKWNEEINIIPYDIITTIRFNTKYINIWTKYITKK
ncbi:hypothetical protein [Haploplasma axanthum]|uniref:Uncharacterized protein n=1 Tax=Haploplasma axanthum TaxID=29552 RepID=A0A449BCI8_HAPAX|nr:hypothetical protein [Haploplasma axanthum]VEU80040.1 Uncharacterised protein [Haploplasma axanthum]